MYIAPKTRAQGASIYPNPATESFTIQHEGDAKEIRIINTQGELVGLRATQSGSTQTKMQIDDLHLSSGLYFLQVDRSALQKLIIK